MKKIIIALYVILVILTSMLVAAGLKLNSLSNSLAETENAIQKLKRRAETEVVSAKVDTLTFEQEMDIVDSAIKAQKNSVYKSIYEVPNREVHYKYGEWHQTIVRHPNGMPKIVAAIGHNEKYTDFRVRGIFLLFLDENGRLVAQGERPETLKLGRWHCEAQADTLVRFMFSNPNKCMKLMK